MTKPSPITYSEAGVDTEKEEAGLQGLLRWLNKTLSFPLKDGIGLPLEDIGLFANVIDIGRGNGLALSTDGVGTKIIVAQMMNKYDTIGIDLVAMNVNDVLCVGARPISMIDYIAVQEPNPQLLEEIGRGLYQGAKIANITIVGGEIAQLREMIKAEKENFGFDLAGMCVGICSIKKIINGQNVKEGDVVIGIESSGIHSNGFTLARKTFFDQLFKVDDYSEELNKTFGEELITPTHIYVSEILELLDSGINIKALVHITSDGFLNLLRVKSPVGYIIDYLPDTPPVFSLIQKLGKISDAHMFEVFNMGIGFCVVIPEKEAENVLSIVEKHNKKGYKIGYVVSDKQMQGKVKIEPRGLMGEGGKFYKVG